MSEFLNMTEQQRNCIPDVHFDLIPIRNLVSNQNYQRPISDTHISTTVEAFDIYQINPVKVSRRDGINYVFDGQHTIEIIAEKSGSRDTPVWCMVYDDLEYQEEAHVFAEQQKLLDAPLAVEKGPLKNYYPAEEYHQDYLDKNPSGYCHLPASLFAFARKANCDE